jgi:hypothetical protein
VAASEAVESSPAGGPGASRSWTIPALLAAAALGLTAFFLYSTTLRYGVDEEFDGWSFGPPLAHPWIYGGAVATALVATGLLLVGLVGLSRLVRAGAAVARVGVWLAVSGTVALLVAGVFQAYLVVLVATTSDSEIPELILAKGRFELEYLLAAFAGMTGLVVGFVLTAFGLARAGLVSRWPALAVAGTSLAVAVVSLWAVPLAAIALGWLAVDLGRRAPPARSR